METIIAGRVGTQERAEQLMAELHKRGVAWTDMQAFYVNPPGQHGTYPLGGDVRADPGTRESGMGQAAGIATGAAAGLAAGAVVGAAVIPPMAPIVAIGLAAAGAHAGGMAGALASSRTPTEEKHGTETSEPDADAIDTRRGGMMLAVHPGTLEKTVISVMEAAGVEDLERTNGEWRDGEWVDFDPLMPPRKIGVEGRNH